MTFGVQNHNQIYPKIVAKYTVNTEGNEDAGRVHINIFLLKSHICKNYQTHDSTINCKVL